MRCGPASFKRVSLGMQVRRRALQENAHIVSTDEEANTVGSAPVVLCVDLGACKTSKVSA